MKTTFLFVIFTFFTVAANAQDQIEAMKIIDGINQKQNIQYDGLTVVGDLDFTELQNKTRKEVRGWSGGEYKSVVEVPIVFRNCTFKGSVIAYKNLKDSKRTKLLGIPIDNQDGTTYSADFRKNVVFENCVFEQQSAFKYSTFSQIVNFKGSKFSQDANFKYAKFEAESDFSEASFSGLISFKYANFREKSYFEKADFRAYADFKYTEFRNPVSFNSSVFKAYSDFKYTHFPTGSTLNNTDFRAGTDFKYSNAKNMR